MLSQNKAAPAHRGHCISSAYIWRLPTSRIRGELFGGRPLHCAPHVRRRNRQPLFLQALPHRELSSEFRSRTSHPANTRRRREIRATVGSWVKLAFGADTH